MVFLINVTTVAQLIPVECVFVAIFSDFWRLFCVAKILVLLSSALLDGQDAEFKSATELGESDMHCDVR